MARCRRSTRARRSSCTRSIPSSTSRSRRRASPKRRWSRSWRRRASAARRPTRTSVDDPGPRLRREARGALLSDDARHQGQRAPGRVVPRHPRRRPSRRRWKRGSTTSRKARRDWVKLLGDFYAPFKVDLDKAAVHMRDLKREEIPTDFKCEKCKSPMVIKWGRNGEFLACSGYPECKNTQGVHRATRTAPSRLRREPTTDEKCETCGAPMLVKRGRFGEFLACSRYPECKTTRPISLGVNCPRPELRRLPHREALAARQGLLRLQPTTPRPAATSCRGIVRCRRSARSAARRSWSSARTGAAAGACAASPRAAATPRRRPRPARPAAARPPATLPTDQQGDQRRSGRTKTVVVFSLISFDLPVNLFLGSDDEQVSRRAVVSALVGAARAPPSSTAR